MEPSIEIQTTQNDLKAQGHTPLTKEELLALISGNTVIGDYEYSGHRIYRTFMNPNGEMEAKNDWGSHEFGKWQVEDDGCLSVTWDGYWEDWTAAAFKVDGEIKFYNIENGTWQTTFNTIMPGEQSLDV